MQSNKRLPASRRGQGLGQKRETFIAQSTAALTLDQRIKADNARVSDIRDPVDLACWPYLWQVGKRSPERFSIIVIARHHQQSLPQSLELLACNSVTLGTAIITDVAGHKDGIQGSDGFKPVNERVYSPPKKAGRVELTRDQQTLWHNVKVGQVKKPRHIYLIPARKKACTNCL